MMVLGNDYNWWLKNNSGLNRGREKLDSRLPLFAILPLIHRSLLKVKGGGGVITTFQPQKIP